MKFRAHILCHPNTQTTKAYSLDGFCAKTIRFCRILKGLGHHVTLYASEENEAPCDELVTCISKAEQERLLCGSHYSTAAADNRYPMWQIYNAAAIKEIGKRKRPRDLILHMGGFAQKEVCDAHPELMAIEYGIGYEGSCEKYRVFESYAWMHETYGRQGIKDGRYFDTVIHGFFDQKEFPFRAKPDDYFIYGGRLTPRKGISIAQQACRAAGVKIKIFGHGDRSLIDPGTEYLGEPSEEERNQILAGARALLAPTMYIEPFNGVVAQAQLCGTPVISTDFGAFPETVEQGKSGFRCSVLRDFIAAIEHIDEIDRLYVRDRARSLFSLEAVAPKYQAYLERLNLLWGDGWNTL